MSNESHGSRAARPTGIPSARVRGVLAAVPFVFSAGLALAGDAAAPAGASGAVWWAWPLLIFAFCLAIGVIAAMGGVGGGVLFVPLAGAIFPFHLDYIRGTGLVMALSGALSASPTLMRGGFTNLRLSLPLSLVASVSALAGARIGLLLPEQTVQAALGALILIIALLMSFASRAEYPVVAAPGRIAAWLRMEGAYWEPCPGREVRWRVHRAGLGLALFAVVGFIAGVFGLGAGWANVPVLNLVMGAPLKVSVASSSLILAVSNTSAAWVYLHQGAVLALITVPAVIGIMLGAPLGARMLTVLSPGTIRRIVVGILALAGARALMKGIGL